MMEHNDTRGTRDLILDLLRRRIGNELQDALLRQLETWTRERQGVE